AFCGFYYPAESESKLAVWIDLARHLVVGATDATRADFYGWRSFVECFFQKCYRVALLFKLVHHFVDNFPCSIFFTTFHYVVDEFGNFDRAVDFVRLRQMLSFHWATH